MRTLHIAYTLIVVSIFGISIFAYLHFYNYRPGISDSTAEVQSVSSERTYFDIPYIDGFKELGVTETSESIQVTLEVPKSAEDVYSFYRNVLAEQGWTPDTHKESNGFIVDTYKRKDSFLTISISREKNNTYSIVGINVTQD